MRVRSRRRKGHLIPAWHSGGFSRRPSVRRRQWPPRHQRRAGSPSSGRAPRGWEAARCQICRPTPATGPSTGAAAAPWKIDPPKGPMLRRAPRRVPPTGMRQVSARMSPPRSTKTPAAHSRRPPTVRASALAQRLHARPVAFPQHSTACRSPKIENYH